MALDYAGTPKILTADSTNTYKTRQLFYGEVNVAASQTTGNQQAQFFILQLDDYAPIKVQVNNRRAESLSIDAFVRLIGADAETDSYSTDKKVLDALTAGTLTRANVTQITENVGGIRNLGDPFKPDIPANAIGIYYMDLPVKYIALLLQGTVNKPLNCSVNVLAG